MNRYPQVLNERLRFVVVVVDEALPLALLVTMMPPVGFFVLRTFNWNLPPPLFVIGIAVPAVVPVTSCTLRVALPSTTLVCAVTETVPPSVELVASEADVTVRAKV